MPGRLARRKQYSDFLCGRTPDSPAAKSRSWDPEARITCVMQLIERGWINRDAGHLWIPLLQGANLLGDGAEMLLEILDPGLIGGAPYRCVPFGLEARAIRCPDPLQCNREVDALRAEPPHTGHCVATVA